MLSMRSPLPILAMLLSFISAASYADNNDAANKAPTDLAGEIGEYNDDTIRLRFLAIVPPHPNPLRDGRSSPYYDPTVIPYSGWQFFSPEGEPQPWIKRSGFCYTKTGQYTDYRHPNLYRMLDYWTVSGDMTDVTARPEGKQSTRFVQRVPSFDFKSRPLNGYRYSEHYWAVKDPNQIPNEMSYRIAVSGTRERLATLKPEQLTNAKFPLGEITYFGAARTDTPHYQKLKKQKHLPDDFKPTFEITGNLDWDKEQWSYSFDWIQAKKLTVRRYNYLFPEEAEFHVYTDMAEDEFRGLMISRQKNIIEHTKPFSLKVIKEKWKNNLTAEKVSITREHTFGEPVSLELVAQGSDGPCLIDLEQAKTYAIPEDVQGVELAKYLEEKQIDLRFLINMGDRAVVRTVGCAPYILHKAYWEKTPYECVRYFDEIRNGTLYQIPVVSTVHTFEQQLDSIFLTTTSDGSMFIFRIDQLDEQDFNRPAKVKITIRKVIAP
jgi:hypothetical protein